MYSNKKNINILVSLLVEHGVTDVVVCPGSRNAALIHDFDVCDRIACYPVTDERSAGFVALGMAQAKQRPVAVCVTSGTALLNLAPAVAEATYQQNGIVVISADRPAAWIGQNDGQTLPQVGALAPFVAKTVDIAEPHDADEEWHVNRLVNEALIAAKRTHRPSVHINVPLKEPLFAHTTATLEPQRAIEWLEAETQVPQAFAEALKKAKRPMLVVGHLPKDATGVDAEALKATFTVLSDTTNGMFCDVAVSDDVFDAATACAALAPDLILQVGGDLVSKKMKRALRQWSDADLWVVSDDGEVHDCLTHTAHVVHAGSVEFLTLLAKMDCCGCEPDFYAKNVWTDLIATSRATGYFAMPFSQMQVVKELEAMLGRDSLVQYSNGNAIRLANLFAHHQVWCNRGVNGIDGSVSTAVGFAVASAGRPVYLVTGDLSFFYDQNALWNTLNKQNLHIVVLNNGEGGIFRHVKDFGHNPLAMGAHHATAEGICLENGVRYMQARTENECRDRLLDWVNSEGPVLLEVMTDTLTDAETMARYHADNANFIKNKLENI